MSWFNFYKERVNTTYQDYFENKYSPFLDMINRLKNNNGILELGCGIGSVSKAIGGVYSGFDLDEQIVQLANINNDTDVFYTQNMFEIDYCKSKNVLKVTHGVLEHFSDVQLDYIAEKCKYSIHYVPLDKYETPSFGDERLLPYEFWLDKMKPKFYQLFNDEHDLLFIKRSVKPIGRLRLWDVSDKNIW